MSVLAMTPPAECVSGAVGLKVVQDGLIIEVGTGASRLMLASEAALGNGTAVPVELCVVPPVSSAETPISLHLGAEWVMRRGNEKVALAAPKLPHGQVLTVLESAPTHVWLWAGTSLVHIDLGSGDVVVVRWRSRLPPRLIEGGEAPLLLAGNELLRCQLETGCLRERRIPLRVDTLVTGARGLIAGVSGAKGGLYRAPGRRLEQLTLLVEGRVSLLCDLGGGEVRALVERGQEWRIVAAVDATPAVRVLDWPELVTNALLATAEPAPELVAAVLALAGSRGWPAREAMILKAARDGRPALRRLATPYVAQLRSARGTAALWLLARDSDAEVREEALQAAAARCQVDSTLACSSVLRWFLGDSEVEISWLARDNLLAYHPAEALAGADQAYQLSAIARLVALAQGDATSVAAAALGRLAQSPDPAVSEAARTALEGVLP